MATVSLSTMWMHDRFGRPREFFLAATEMGFRGFELTSVATTAFYDEIHPGEFSIRSLHDPAPATIGLADMSASDMRFTSLDEEQRRSAVAIAKQSIDIAQRYGAQVVILHLGRSEADPRLRVELENLHTAGRINSAQAETIRAQLQSGRAANHEQHMNAVRRSLDEIVPYAADRGIRLGIENRRHIPQIPNFEEMKWLLAVYADSTIGYWHDVGHAEAQAAVGMTPHWAWLEEFAPRLVGVHLHDVIGLSDHHTPGSGCVDWLGLAPLLPEHGLRTAEIGSGVPPEAVRAGIDHLAAVGWIEA